MFKDLFDGIASYIKALRIVQQQRLWGYFLIPGLITLAALVVVALVVGYTYGPVNRWLSGLIPWDWAGRAAGITGGVVYGLLLFTITIVSLKYIIIILLGPFLSPMSQKVECSYNGKHYPPSGMMDNIRLMKRGLSVALTLIVQELLLTIPLYILMWVPGLAVVISPLLFVVQSYFAGRGNMDFILERRYGVRQSLRASHQHKWLAIGNGLVYMLLLSTVVGVFFAPILSVAGITVELVKRLDAMEERDL